MLHVTEGPFADPPRWWYRCREYSVPLSVILVRWWVLTIFCARRLSRECLGRGGCNGPIVVAATHSWAALHAFPSSSRVSRMSCPSSSCTGWWPTRRWPPPKATSTRRSGGSRWQSLCAPWPGSTVVIWQAAQASAVLDDALRIGLGDNWRAAVETRARAGAAPLRSWDAS